MNGAELRSVIEEKWPRDATCWCQATDEVRDMSRWAREALGLDDSHATDFYELKTPAQWNSVGVDSIISYFEQMDEETRAAYLKSIRYFLTGDEADDQ